jgi:hypothetical protein
MFLLAQATDPLSAASAQITTWTPIVLNLTVLAFGIAVSFKALKLAKRGLDGCDGPEYARDDDTYEEYMARNGMPRTDED